MRVLVSACLLGENCKYNGGNNRNERVLNYIKDKEVIPVCPEILTILGTPRPSVEIAAGRIIYKEGNDRELIYREGVEKALSRICGLKIDLAILQSRSPTCGVNEIYDGTFSGKKIPGSGIFAQALRKKGIPLMDAEDVPAMMLCGYRPKYCQKLAELFYETVHTVNRKDYTREQVDAWADGQVDLEAWNRSFLEHHTVVAWESGQLAGFGDMARDGYLDRLYVHKDFQGRGIASAICDELERTSGRAAFTVHASITSRSFFEKRGYRMVKEQQVERHGVKLTNFIMEKLPM